MSASIVRAATSADLDAIHRFAGEVVHETYDGLVDEEYASALIETWWTPEALGPEVAAGRVLVAAADGQIIGLAHRGVWQDEPVLWKLYVAAHAQNRGVGVHLLDEVVAALHLEPEPLGEVAEHVVVGDESALPDRDLLEPLHHRHFHVGQLGGVAAGRLPYHVGIDTGQLVDRSLGDHVHGLAHSRGVSPHVRVELSGVVVGPLGKGDGTELGGHFEYGDSPVGGGGGVVEDARYRAPTR